jgi:hypothetical protein
VVLLRPLQTGGSFYEPTRARSLALQTVAIDQGFQVGCRPGMPCRPADDNLWPEGGGGEARAGGTLGQAADRPCDYWLGVVTGSGTCKAATPSCGKGGRRRAEAL